MVQRMSTTNLTELLLECVTQPDPMLSMLEWLCDRLMEAEVSAKFGANKSDHWCYKIIGEDPPLVYCFP